MLWLVTFFIKFYIFKELVNSIWVDNYPVIIAEKLLI